MSKKEIKEDQKMLQALWQFFLQHGHAHVPATDREVEDLYSWTRQIRKHKNKLPEELINQLDQMNFAWSASSHGAILWETRFHELVAYKKKHGNCKVPQEYKENRALGNWVSRQRKQKSEGLLSDARFQRLQQIGFLWKEDIQHLRDQQWERSFNKLKAYKKKYGHIDRLEVKKTDEKLSIWMDSQIARQHNLSEKRKRELLDIGFLFDKPDWVEEKWKKKLQELKEFYRKHGHSSVPTGSALGNFVSRIRRDKEKLSRERLAELEKLNFRWAGEYSQKKWNKRVKELMAFKEKHGHCEVSRSMPEYKHLAQWISDLRKTWMRLPEERKEQLLKLGFTTKSSMLIRKDKRWNKLLKKFIDLKAHYGACYLVNLFEQHPDVYEWVLRQKKSKTKLSERKLKALQEASFPWNEDYTDHLWRLRFKELVAYKEKHGTTHVPQNSQEYPVLAWWVNHLRTYPPKGKKRKMLDEIGFLWSGMYKEHAWNQRFQELEEFYRQHGHLQVYSRSPLGCWLYQQRKHWNRLSEEKKQKLETLFAKQKHSL